MFGHVGLNLDIFKANTRNEIFLRIKYEIKMRSLIEYNLLMAFRDQGQIMKIWEKVWIHNYSLPSRLKYLNRNVAMFVFNNLKY